MTVVGAVLMTLGCFFLLVGAIGVLRMPDFYTRLHAMGKCDTLGLLLSLAGLVLFTGFSAISLKVMAIWVFIVLANPTATHALSRAAYRAGLQPWFRKE